MTDYTPWPQAYALVSDYASERGYLSVRDETHLGRVFVGSWISRQQQLVRGGKHSITRIELLSRIPGGLPTHRLTHAWVDGWPALRAALMRHGLNLPEGTAEAKLLQSVMEDDSPISLAQRHLCLKAAGMDSILAPAWFAWSTELKRAHREEDREALAAIFSAGSDSLHPWQVRALQGLAPNPAIDDARWMNTYRALFSYILKTGRSFPDADVVHNNEAIGLFTISMRKKIDAGELDVEKAEALLMLPGWSPAVGNCRDRATRTMARVFLSAMEHGKFPLKTPGVKSWVRDARFRMNGEALPDRQRYVLNACPGFTWRQRPNGNHLFYRAGEDLIARKGRLDYTPWTVHNGLELGSFMANLSEEGMEEFVARGSRPYEIAEPMRGERLWSHMFQMLHEWTAQNDGQTPDPEVRYEGTPLGAWYWTMKYFGELGLIPAARQRQLAESVSDASWIYSLAKVELAIANRNLENLKGTPKRWLDQVHRWHHMGIRNDQVIALEQVRGFSWATPDSMRFISDLAQFKALVGDSPRGFERYRTEDMVNGFSPSTFVIRHRTMFLNGVLPGWKHRALEVIPGWTWVSEPLVARRVSTEEWVRVLARWQADFGPVMPERAVVFEELNLGAWVETMRQRYEIKTLSAGMVANLEAIPGWSWASTKEAVAA